MFSFRFIFLCFFICITGSGFSQHKSGTVIHVSRGTGIKKDTFSNKTPGPVARPAVTAHIDAVCSKLSALLEAQKFSEFAPLLRKSLQQFPGNARLMELKKQFVIKDYKANVLKQQYLSEDKYFEKQPSSQSCHPGTVNALGHSIVLQRLNYIRRLAGLYDSCVFDPELNKKCQAAAHMMDANNHLDHSPKSNWKCYSKDGASAAGSSNLSLGYAFVDALMGQMTDDGSGNAACGHRRWILNPYNNVFGHGSTANAMTLSVFGSANPKLVKKTGFSDSGFVSWPTADYFPADLMPERWSFSYADADFSQAKVTVSLNGKPLKVRLEPVKNGYGMNTVVWVVDGTVQADKVYTVSISNVKIVKGWGKRATTSVRNFAYKVTPLTIE